MLELKNVSKFYYSKNTVASGFTKVNLKLDVGEFVAVTGESGSGKSTLLNVISGLDSYEEGEMYINGEETSGYTEKDFENYRKKYIGNIFQNFNLVNSYTVYQNIELVLLINGYKKHKIKGKILETLEKVGLIKYKNTKVSKLSGGQKQRVAIARALVKETPIIVADEPTGNLDTKTAENIIELLKKIAQDKLIIIVTHNYEQVEKYVTRKITMHDGRMIEDKKFKVDQTNESEKLQAKNKGDIQNSKTQKDNIQNKNKRLNVANKLLLGIRNTFNIKTKFLLLLAVYLFVSVAAVAGYSSLQKQQYEESNLGYNNYFRETSDKRIIIKKQDLTQITTEDYAKIKNLSNVDYIVENDLLLDQYLAVNIGQSGFTTSAISLDNFRGEVNFGKMPQNDKEVLVAFVKDHYYLPETPEELIGKTVKMINYNNSGQATSSELVVSGFSYLDETQANSNFGVDNKIYVSNNVLDEIRKNINISFGNVEIEFNDKILQSTQYNIQNKVIPNLKVPYGKAYVSEDMNYLTKNNNCINYKMNIKVTNTYYSDSMNVKITKTYNKKKIKTLLGISDFNAFNGAIFVNPEQYSEMYNKGNYQSSIFIKNEKEIRETQKELENMNFTTLYVKDSIVDSMGEGRVFVNTFRIVATAVVIVVLFFISYFIIKIIMKSRNIYFSTIRILGATRENAKELLRIELFTILNIAYVITIGLIILVHNNILKIQYLQSMITYLKISDLCILYFALVIVSLLISARYSKQLFKKSAMNTYREEEV